MDFRAQKSLAALICLAAFAQASGQSAPPPAPTPSASPAAGGDEMILFESIPSVYGASKYEQSAAEAPASVTIVTAEEIRKYGYRTIGEILRSVRGFYTTYDRNYTYLGVRGFSRPGDYNTRVLMLVDGHRMNEQVYDAAYFGTEAPLDVDLIERVEIIRGPSSSLYGTNAFLAVVNIVTRSAKSLKGAELSAEAASFHTSKGRASYGNSFGSGAELLLSASTYHSRGQDLYFEGHDSPPRSDGVARGADGDDYWNALAKLSAGSFSLEGIFASRTKGIPTGSYGTTFGDPRTRTSDSRGALILGFDQEIDDRLQLTASLSYDSYRYEGDYAYSSSLFRDSGAADWWTADAQAVTRHLPKQTIVGGFEYRKNVRQDQSAWDVDPYRPYLRDERHSSSWAVFFQDEWRALPELLLTGGIRYDNYDSFGGTVNPRLAIIWAAQERTTLKFMYGRAFRAPNAYELFYNDGGISQKANPDLTPEIIQNFEIEASYLFKQDLRGVLYAYHYRMRDIITQVVDPADGLLVFRNLDNSSTSGIEAEVDGKLGGLVEGRLSYAWQRAGDAGSGEEPVNSPEQIAKLNLSLPLAGEWLTAAAEAQYTSDRRAFRGAVAQAATVVNLTMSGKVTKQVLSWSASVYNLFDRQYADPAGADNPEQPLIPQDGRSYRLQLRASF